MLPLPRAVYDNMAAHAVEEYPQECCGFLTGTDDPDTWRVQRCTNIQNELNAKDPAQYPRDARTAYVFSRVDMERLFFGRFESAGARVIGFYHSHPDQPAYFSEKDRMEALTDWLDPEPGYLVLSATGDTVTEIRMYRWVGHETGFMEIPVKVV